MNGRIVAVSMSPQKGMRKANVPQATLIEDFGLEGDAHAGNGHRQVSLLSVDSIGKMQAKGLEVGPGDFAENLTIAGLDLLQFPIGQRFRVGNPACQLAGREVILELTQIGKQCHTGCAIRILAGDCIMPREGIFTRVIQGGEVCVGDPIEPMNGGGR